MWDIPARLIRHESSGPPVPCADCGNDCREHYVVHISGDRLHLSCAVAWVNRLFVAGEDTDDGP
jgi:hypothetical protein